MAVVSDVSVRGGLGEASVSCISWAAIFAGASAAIATTIVLAVLGVGVGLTTASPWSGLPSGTTLAVSGAVWLIVMQWLSSALGGYLSGRLRTKWSGVRTEEVFFRDTAHGFLAWCVATIVVVTMVASSTTSLVSGAASAVGGVAASAAQGAGQGAAQQGIAQLGQGADPTAYFTDMLFRNTSPGAQQQDARAEASRILVSGLTEGDVSQQDRAYLAQLVAGRTGLSQADAEKRVNDVISSAQAAKQKAKEAADVARKASATFALFSVLSMLVGAFIAAVAGAVGGRARADNLA
ncbi:hypothetical protein ABLE91_13880 [Aquabacter sp. CN5-332]|uniref:hypothetical protein n=1 Tax=Aquabacter sp. CN5-332 TaxID=3156608 RepID=UPI0032B56482